MKVKTSRAVRRGDRPVPRAASRRIARLVASPPPRRFAPQLALLVDAPPKGDGWLHELKYDGYRIGGRVDRGTAQLLSRNNNDWTERFGPIAAALAKLPVRNALFDGEVTVVLPNGRTSFQALQNASDGGRGELTYFIFDLLHLDGRNLAELPLSERKARLERLLRREPNGVRFSPHVGAEGSRVLDAACKLGAEGIVSKRSDQPYRAGRSSHWQKTKCIARQEFVVAGFTDPQGARSGIGALLVGAYSDDGKLRFAGKVGTGFSQSSALALRRRLDGLERPTTPLSDPPSGRLGREAHWVEPRLVAEVAFTEWTEDGKLRHPSFQGLREDKDPRQVRRETAAPADPPKSIQHRAPRQRPQAGNRGTKRSREEAREEIAGIAITHGDRIVWPDLKISKLELATYYEAVAEWMVPHVAGRPLTLVRCPDGIAAGCFYMKHSHIPAPAGLRRVEIREKLKTGEYLVADSVTGLVALAQMNVIEIHTWNSTADDLERPDRFVIDLDPGPSVGWPDVVAAARRIRAALDVLGLTSFVKSTGGRGLHVVVPLRPHAPWQSCLAFTRRFAEIVAGHEPRLFTTAFAKRGREKQILIDYMRNNRTNTSVAAYSARARPGAPVSMPLDWSELRASAGPERHTVRTALRRLSGLRADPWSGYASAATKLDPAIARLADL